MGNNAKKGSIGAGIFWMFFLSIILAWLPGIGTLIAGIVGGKKSGGVGGAIAAVFLPGIVVGASLFFLTSFISGIPYLGVIAGAGGLILSLIGIGPLLIGAIIGGALA